MNRLFAFAPALLMALATHAAHAADAPYDETADAKAEIRQALASGGKLPVLVIFGANWCGDCKVLDMALKQGASAPLVAREFKVVKVNVGRFDHNVDVAESYGVPLKKGIPAVAVLSPGNKVLHVTKAGELANARNMGDEGIYTFFKQMAAGSNAPAGGTVH